MLFLFSYLMVKHNCEPLENLILLKSSASITYYLQIKWLYESFTKLDR